MTVAYGFQSLTLFTLSLLQPTMANSVPQSPTLLSTPIKHGLSTMYKFSTNHKYREKEMSDMGNEMRGYFVGPMPAAKFLDTFFPKKSINNTLKAKQFTKGSFNKVVSCEGEKQAYCPFVGLFLMPTRCCY
jgi:hypothetical protein